MGLILNAPQLSAMPTPAPRLTSYRYWEDYAPKYLRAIRDTVARVIDDQERQRHLFEEAPAAAPSLFAAAPATAVPSSLAGNTPAKNETLGNLLSPSQANQFLNCSARWWFKYGAGLPDPRGGSLVRGSTVHKCIEHWFKLRMTGATPEIDDIAEFYEDAWEAQAADAQFAKTDDIDDLKRSGARLLRLYLEQVAPEIRPAKLEQKVTGEIGGVRVQGWIDQVDSAGRILDVKTAEKSPSGIGSDYAFQLATYRQILPGASGKASRLSGQQQDAQAGHYRVRGIGRRSVPHRQPLSPRTRGDSGGALLPQPQQQLMQQEVLQLRGCVLQGVRGMR
jgi:hypothetical protein